MPVDLSAVGYRSDPIPISWDATQAILYALGVGAGSEDPQRELEYTTENTVGVDQAVLPTFPMVLAKPSGRSYGDVNRARVLHAEQTVRLHSSLPPTGSATVVSGIDAILDKGSGALVMMSSTLTDPTGTVMAETVTGAFARGEGGFGGGGGPSSSWAAPDREPDVVVAQRTLAWQPLLYRLSGDRNPLHSDPSVATQGGFPRPIMHGACTYGFVGRALLQGAFDGDGARFGSISARFAAPVMPGDVLRTSIWRSDDGAVFVTHTGEGTLVLDRGVATERGAS